MRAPDLNAPRFRTTYKNILTKDLMAAFKTKYPQYAHYPDEVLIDAIEKHNDVIAEEVRNNREGVELQANLGYLFIGMSCIVNKKKNYVAWNKSIKLGMKVYLKNWHSDNKVGKIYYCNYSEKHRFENRQLWGFNPVRQFKKMTSDAIIKNWANYIILDPHQYIWKLFTTRKNRDEGVKEGIKRLVDYNEFELED